MNISKASELLFGWFNEKESFCISDDLHVLLDATESKKESTASVICALEDFET